MKKYTYLPELLNNEPGLLVLGFTSSYIYIYIYIYIYWNVSMKYHGPLRL